MLYCKEYHVPGFGYYEWEKIVRQVSGTVLQLPVAPVHTKPFSDFDACFNFWLETRME